MSDINLNNLLNTEDIATENEETQALDTTAPVAEAETTEAPAAEAAPLAEAVTDEVETTEAPVAEDEVETTEGDVEAVAPVAEVDTTEAPAADGWVSLYDFITRHSDKITNAQLTQLGFSRVPQGKYMLFVSNDEDNASLVLFDRPNTLWMNSNVLPDSIKVENSGLVIKSPNARYYVGKNNITKVDLNGTNISGIETISRSKDSDSVKVEADSSDRQSADVDTVKLHVKRISPRLYNAIKDMTTTDEIKTGIMEFMAKIYDLNHLVKIEKELLYSLGL
jgi:hypothetical protein